MAHRVYRSKAKRAFWRHHIEAWRASGMSQEAYCRGNGLWPGTMCRWLKMFETEAGYKLEKIEKRKRRRERRMSCNIRLKAVQAFWAMHVEAWIWSGLTATDYAKAHGLARQTLAVWRERLETDLADVDWRSLVHPSARPLVERRSQGAETSTGANADANDSGLTTGAQRRARRTFTDEQKRAIVAEAAAPGATVAAVARAHGIATSMIFRWRAQLDPGREKPAHLAAVRVADGRGGVVPGATDIFDLVPVPDGLIAVELHDGRRALAPAGSDPDGVRRAVAAQERRS